MANSRTVFLVDDDPMQVQMLKDHISSKLNVSVTSFSTGEDCLNNLHLNPEVIVLDYYLDSVDKEAKNGIDILQSIKKQSPETEVIMLSGQDKIEIAVETMKHGAFDYVIKNESAFVRTENVMMNIFKGFKLTENLNMYKKATWFLVAVVALLVILAIVLVATGVGTDNPGAVL